MQLRGKHIVLTGTLSVLKRKEAIAFLEEQGAEVHGSVSNKTEILIIGHRQTSLFRESTKSKKQQVAQTLRKQGQKIYFMSEEEFFDIFQKSKK